MQGWSWLSPTPIAKAKTVTSLVATLSWNMVPRNKQTPNNDKVVMENCIPILNLFLPRRVDSNSTGLLDFHLAPFSAEMFWEMPGEWPCRNWITKMPWRCMCSVHDFTMKNVVNISLKYIHIYISLKIYVNRKRLIKIPWSKVSKDIFCTAESDDSLFLFPWLHSALST